MIHVCRPAIGELRDKGIGIGKAVILKLKGVSGGEGQIKVKQNEGLEGMKGVKVKVYVGINTLGKGLISLLHSTTNEEQRKHEETLHRLPTMYIISFDKHSQYER